MASETEIGKKTHEDATVENQTQMIEHRLHGIRFHSFGQSKYVLIVCVGLTISIFPSSVLFLLQVSSAVLMRSIVQ